MRQLEKVKEEEKWNIGGLHLGLQTVKRAGNRANPDNKAGLVSLWKELHPWLDDVEEHHKYTNPSAKYTNNLRPMIPLLFNQK